MTREAKIGLLTGLGVIVLIGVLLSEYLGGPGGPGGASSASANRMAALPIAQSYRDTQLKPIGVPGMVRPEATEVAVAPAADPVAVAAVAPSAQVVPATPLMNQIGALPRAMASDAPSAPASAPSMEADATPAPAPLPNGPVVAPAITPIQDGPVLAHVAAPNGLPTGVPMFQLNDTQPVSLTTGNSATSSPTAGKAAATAVAGQEYVIGSGDTLMKIAKKFYNSSKPEDCQKIVSANPSYLKSTTTMLVVGKKLTIPGVPPTVAASLRPGDDGAVASAAQVKPATAVMIRTPGAKADSAAAKSTEARKLSKKAESKDSHYVVQSGDTPEKIARKLGGSSDFAKQLMAVNKIKDASKLQVGMKLKLPGK